MKQLQFITLILIAFTFTGCLKSTSYYTESNPMPILLTGVSEVHFTNECDTTVTLTLPDTTVTLSAHRKVVFDVTAGRKDIKVGTQEIPYAPFMKGLVEIIYEETK